jgi:chitodextrinase
MKNILLRLMPVVAAILMVGCTDDSYKITSEVKEGPEPTASFTYVANDLDVQFTSTSTNAESYYWSFGDGTYSTEESPQHTFSSAGTYAVKLKVNSPAGYSSQSEKSFAVAGKVGAFYQYTAQRYREGGFGRVVDFDATSSANAISISWDFGDGTVITDGDFALTHEFPEYKTYKVKITTTGYLGDVAVYETDLEVVPDYEMIRGGDMEAADAAYWTIKSTGYQVEFGYKAVIPSGGSGGCLRYIGKGPDGSYTTAVYQGFYVEAGERFDINTQVRWLDGALNAGVLFFCLAVEGVSSDFLGDGVTPDFTDGNLFVSLINHWGYGAPLAPYDGDLTGVNRITGSPYGGGNYYYGPNADADGMFTATRTGMVYFGIELRNVWGGYFGDFLFDSVSIKLVP